MVYLMGIVSHIFINTIMTNVNLLYSTGILR